MEILKLTASKALGLAQPSGSDHMEVVKEILNAIKHEAENCTNTMMEYGLHQHYSLRLVRYELTSRGFIVNYKIESDGNYPYKLTICW